MKYNNKKTLFIATLLVFIYLSSTVFGFGVAPARKNFYYSSQLHESGSIRLLNNNQQNITLDVSSEGLLSKYIHFNKDTIKITESDSEFIFNYEIAIDEDNLDPGVLDAKLVFTEVQEKEEGIFSTSVSLSSLVVLNIPYEGKHPNSRIIVQEHPQDKVMFLIPVYNKGNLDIDSASVRLDIISSSKRKIVSLESDVINVGANEEKLVQLMWTPKKNGEYEAVVTLSYDDEKISFSREFKINFEGVQSLGAWEKFNISRFIMYSIPSLALVLLLVIQLNMFMKLNRKKDSGSSKSKIKKI